MPTRSDNLGDAAVYTHDAHISEVHINAAWLALGRALLGGFFVFQGLNHFINTNMMATFAASKGVPAPQMAVLGAGLLALLGGLSLLLGAWPRVGALLLIVFLLGVTPTMHNFWAETGAARVNDFGNFLKNIGLLGGACLAAALPQPWPGSVHAHRHVEVRERPDRLIGV
jgi:uncharacterized membrane protein YphA (DoxX/SURF4 family)